MKKLLFAFFLVLTQNFYAQQGFNYKAIIYDNNTLLANQTIQLKFSIFNDLNNTVYQEHHSAQTDANGIVQIILGEGMVDQGTFTNINWDENLHLKVEIDRGNGYQDFGTNALKYVPYAKYADKAGNVFSGNFTDLSNVPSGLSDGDDVNDADHDTTNELQTISKTGNTISLSNGGGSVIDNDTHLSETQVDNYVSNNGYLTQVDNIRGIPVSNTTPNNGQILKFNGIQFVPADDNVSGGSGTDGVVNSAAFSGTVTKTLTLVRSNGLGNITANFTDNDTHLTDANIGAMGYIKNADDADADATNELQTISKSGNTVTLSNGGGSFTDADTHLTESQVDAYVANNGYLTSETDGSVTNELQTISKSGNTVTLSNGGGSFTDADTHLTDANIGSMGYIKSADDADADATNELQTLSISGNTLSLSDGNSVTLPTSSSSDVDFLEVGTGSAPNNILDNIYHTGNISIGHTNIPTAKMDILNNGTSTANNANTGIYIQNSNTSNTNKIGVKTILEAPTSNANAYAVKNEITDNGDGDLYGSYSYIGGLNGDGDHFGAYYYMIGEGTGLHTGSKADLSTLGTAEQIGFDASISTWSNANTATQIGVNTHIYGDGTGVKYAMNNLVDGDADGYIYGVKNEISNTANGKQYGVYNKLTGTGTNKHYGVYNTFSGTGSGDQIGVTVNNYNSGDATHIGAHNLIYGSGSGEHIGVKNELFGAGTGNQIGVRNMISNTNGTNQYGVYTTLDATSGDGDRFATRNDLFGSGNGNLYGVRNQISNPGTGSQTGTYNNVYGSGSGMHIGIKNSLSGSGNGAQYGNQTIVDNDGSAIHYGTYNRLSGTGTGEQYANYTKVNNSGNAVHYGNYSEMSGSGSGVHYANYNKLSGSGTGLQYGVKTVISNTNNSYQYGSHTEITGNGGGRHYGSYVDLSGTGNGKKYGFYSNVTGSGSGSKIGVYATVDPAANGNHYAIYARATRNTDNTYAGYFYGDAKVTGKLKSVASGTADMKAYIYGEIDADASSPSIVTDASSSGFTMTRLSKGKYQITFNNSTGGGNKYIVMTSFVNDAATLFWITNKTANSFVVNIKTGYTRYDYDFEFVVYKK